MTPEQQGRVTATLQRFPASHLATSARVMVAAPRLLASERLALAWIHDELERRAGGIRPEQEATFDALLDQGLNYLDALLRIFPDLLTK
jgi:hypothetical protein